MRAVAIGGIGALVGACAWFAAGLGAADARDTAAYLADRARGVACVAVPVLRRVVLALAERARAAKAAVGQRSRPAFRPGEVSDMVEIVSLGLTAGLSFDAALGMYCERTSSALSRRMAEARFSWQVGIAPREDALLEAARDLEAPALARFGTTVCQALRFGAPVSEALMNLGREVRLENVARVERAIERAPVKILIPTGTLILPALLLAIVGPLLAASGMI